MLPNYAMVASVIESLYEDTCNVVEHQKKVNQTDKSTYFEDVTVEQNVPCRLSYSRSDSTSESDSASKQIQDIEVFMSNSIDVKAGSKLEITHKGETIEFKSSGLPAKYGSHQEIHLEIFKGWS